MFHVLGNVAEESLGDIWHGGGVERLRRAIGRNDFGLGCEDCAVLVATGASQLAHARSYDVLGRSGLEHPWPRQLELALTNTCNLQCVQCTGELSSAIRARREALPPLPSVYDDDFFAGLVDFLPHLERVVFIGGEPFLGREPGRVIDLLLAGGWTPRCVVSTNGTVWNDRVERMLDRLPVDVSVSLDGSEPEVFERIRVGARFAEVVANLDRFRSRAAANGTSVNVNHCLMVDNASGFAGFLRFADERDLDVHVNTVTNPARFSLYRLPNQELESVLECMDGSLSRVGPLGRNAPVWEVEMQRLRQHLARRNEGPRGLAVSDVGTRATDGRSVSRVVAEELAGGGPVHTVEVRGSEVITRVTPDPSDVLGMDLRPVVGGHISLLLPLFSTALGEVVSSELVHGRDGVDVRKLRFAGEATPVWAVLDVGGSDGDDRWYIVGGVDEVVEP